jgi:hypothetical protein
MNSLSANNQPFPPKDAKPGECPPDNNLAENSQENLDARLDHAIEETFPTSDPISVHITKGPEPDHHDQDAFSSSTDDYLDQSEQDPTEHLLDQVRNALHDVADSASGAARDAYDQGRRYVQQAGERYPQAERMFARCRQAVTHRIQRTRCSAVWAGVAGYALALVIHRERRDPSDPRAGPCADQSRIRSASRPLTSRLQF